MVEEGLGGTIGSLFLARISVLWEEAHHLLLAVGSLAGSLFAIAPGGA